MPDTNQHVDDTPQELQVTFSPNLYLQRRGWVFDIMRREGITQVLDVGCGEGELIGCLCNPAPWLQPPPPSILPPPPHSTDPDTLPNQYTFSHKNHWKPRAPGVDENMHIKEVFAIDISPYDLQEAIEITSPRPPPTCSGLLSHVNLRWEPTTVKIWQGGLEVFNPEFVDIECIVSTEVYVPINIATSYTIWTH